MACDGCGRRKDAIIASWDFGEFFWDVLANIVGTIVIGLPIVLAVLRSLKVTV